MRISMWLVAALCASSGCQKAEKEVLDEHSAERQKVGNGTPTDSHVTPAAPIAKNDTAELPTTNGAAVANPHAGTQSSPEAPSTGSQAGEAKAADAPSLKLLPEPLERLVYPADIEVSSFLRDNNNAFLENHHPNHLIDANPKTAWIEGVHGSGKGEWIRIGLRPLANTTAARVRLLNGNHRSWEAFKAGSRIKEMTVTLHPRGVTKKVKLQDQQRWQEVVVDQPSGPLEAIELKIDAVTRGQKKRDLAISEIEVFLISTTPADPSLDAPRRKEVSEWVASRLTLRDLPWKSVAAGQVHTCALKEGGHAVCWGEGRFAANAAPAEAVQAVFVGGDQSCGIRQDGTPTCWGSLWGLGPKDDCDYVKHGLGVRDLRARGYDAKEVANQPPSDTFAAIAPGFQHTCGRKKDGTVLCWGCPTNGVLEAPSSKFKSISAGWEHTCGIRNDDSLACWGNNERSQLEAPTGSFVHVSAGGDHTCALATDGHVQCWGAGRRLAPQADSPEYGQARPPKGKFVAIAAGGYHTCALREKDRTAVCWGLGQRRKGPCAPQEDKITCGQAMPPRARFHSISAGGYHTCGLTEEGRLLCWGAAWKGLARFPKQASRPKPP